MKYASGCKGNDEMGRRVSFNTEESASAMRKYFKEMHHNSGKHSMFCSAHQQAFSKSVWTQYSELRSVAFAF